ncbi:MAG: NUDIX domain-containing protein [Candidatus Magasanikbacteria bacterium]
MGEVLRPEIKEPSKEKETREVVRVFLAQSRSVEEMWEIIQKMQEEKTSEKPLEKPFDFTRLLFNTIVWAEKDSISVQNSGQVMPVGGKVDETDKTYHAAAMREVLEETHLRVLGLQEFDHNIDYTLDTKNGNVDIKQKLFFAKILPTNTAFPIDPEEDKIKKFHNLDLSMMASLYADKGEFSDGKKVELLGNLRLSEKEDEKVLRDGENKRKAVDVFFELADKSQSAELEKRQSIIKLLYEYLSQIKPCGKEIDSAFDKFLQASNFFNHQIEFQNICTLMKSHYGDDDFWSAFKTAIEVSNLEEELVGPAKQESNIESALHTIYALLETQGDYDVFFDIAKKNHKVAHFLDKLQKFIEALTDDKDKGNGPAYQKKDLRKKLGALKDLPDELLASIFCESFGINEENVNTRLQNINVFLRNLVQKAISPRINGNDNNHYGNSVETTDEVSDASLGQLIRRAFPFGDNSWKDNFDSTEEMKLEKKRQVFEARRQLSLLDLYTATDEYYDRVVERVTKGPINKLWNDFMSPPQQFIWTKDVVDENKNLQDVKIYTIEDEESSKIGMRRLKAPNLKDKYLIQTMGRTKDRDSLYRKMIERGYDDPRRVIDIFGRALVIASNPSDPKSFSYIRNIGTRNLRIDGRLKAYTDMDPVLDIIEHMSGQPGVQIISYTPTPMKGEKFSSKGAAGGGDIRLAKFYIKHTDDNGEVRYEEVQVYTPSADKTAFFWKKQKEEDDKRYYFDRLMASKGFQSVLELLFPTAIYGNVMHNLRGSHTQNKKNGVKK